MQTQADLLVGDTFLSAACIAYYGAFTGPFRATLVAGWIARCQELGIPTSQVIMLRSLLAPPAQVHFGICLEPCLRVRSACLCMKAWKSMVPRVTASGKHPRAGP